MTEENWNVNLDFNMQKFADNLKTYYSCFKLSARSLKCREQKQNTPGEGWELWQWEEEVAMLYKWLKFLQP